MLSGNAFCLEKKIIRFRCGSKKFADVVNSWAAFIEYLGWVIEAYDLMANNSYVSYLRSHLSNRMFSW